MLYTKYIVSAIFSERLQGHLYAVKLITAHLYILETVLIPIL